MSASAELAIDGALECPEWCPEGVWPMLKRELVLVAAKVNRNSIEQIANSLGLPFSKVLGLKSSRKWRVQIEEAREDLAQSSIMAAYRSGEILHEKLNDPLAVAKLSARDASIIKKQMSENALNLSNGVVGAPALGISFNDVKILMGSAIEKPVVRESKE